MVLKGAGVRTGTWGNGGSLPVLSRWPAAGWTVSGNVGRVLLAVVARFFLSGLDGVRRGSPAGEQVEGLAAG